MKPQDFFKYHKVHGLCRLHGHTVYNDFLYRADFNILWPPLFKPFCAQWVRVGLFFEFYQTDFHNFGINVTKRIGNL